MGFITSVSQRSDQKQRTCLLHHVNVRSNMIIVATKSCLEVSRIIDFRMAYVSKGTIVLTAASHATTSTTSTSPGLRHRVRSLFWAIKYKSPQNNDSLARVFMVVCPAGHQPISIAFYKMQMICWLVFYPGNRTDVSAITISAKEALEC